MLIYQCRPRFSSNSETITYPATPIKIERVNLPPGTNSGNLIAGDLVEYLSDQDIAAGRIPKRTNTKSRKKKRKQCHITSYI